jgi:YD repeat-containing protein
VNDKPYQTYTYTMNAAGQTLTEDSVNDNGTRNIIYRDPDHVANYSVLTNNYVGTALSSQTGTYYTGDSWSSAFTADILRSFTYTDTGANDHPWQTYGYTYDALGRILTEVSVNDDGTSYDIFRDPAHTAGYSILTNNYGLGHVLQTQTGSWYNGDTWAAAYAATGGLTSFKYIDTGANDHGWTSYTYGYDALGRISSEDSRNDDGTRVLLLRDVAGLEAYSTLSHFYGANGVETNLAGVLDNADTYTALFTNGVMTSKETVDAGPNDHPWAKHTELFGSGAADSLFGGVGSDTLDNDDGTRTIKTNDLTGLRPFSSYLTFLTASGQLAQEIVTARDGIAGSGPGGAVTTNFDWNSTKAWSIETAVKTLAGVDVVTTQRNDNGTTVVTVGAAGDGQFAVVQTNGQFTVVAANAVPVGQVSWLLTAGEVLSLGRGGFGVAAIDLAARTSAVGAIALLAREVFSTDTIGGTATTAPLTPGLRVYDPHNGELPRVQRLEADGTWVRVPGVDVNVTNDGRTVSVNLDQLRTALGPSAITNLPGFPGDPLPPPPPLITAPSPPVPFSEQLIPPALNFPNSTGNTAPPVYVGPWIETFDANTAAGTAQTYAMQVQELINGTGTWQRPDQPTTYDAIKTAQPWIGAVQENFDKAIANYGAIRPGQTPQDYGIKVHAEFARLNGLDARLTDAGVQAEVTVTTRGLTGDLGRPAGSQVLDVYAVKDKTLFYLDAKTGGRDITSAYVKDLATKAEQFTQATVDKIIAITVKRSN